MHKITLDGGSPAGVAVESARSGQDVQVLQSEFLTSEDGDVLVQRLEEIERVLLGPALKASGIGPSQVDHALVIIRRDNSVDIWLNELNLVARCVAKTKVEAGTNAYTDDIADIVSAEWEGITIPDDAGFVAIISKGWRKGLLYDFSGLHHEPAQPRDVGKQFGAALAYLMFQVRLRISQGVWDTLFASGWFPFTWLTDAVVQKMVAHAKAGWNIDELLPDITSDVQAHLPEFRKFVESAPQLAHRSRVLTEAMNSYERREFAAATAVLYPQVEGILRDAVFQAGGTPGKEALMSAASNDPNERRHTYSLLLPERFETYLRSVVFRGENFNNPSSVQYVTRHSVAHGVAPQDKLDEKAATVALLIIRQLALLVG